MTTFGLQLPKFTFPVPDAELFEHVAGMATAADDAGFSSLWVMDHFYQLPGLGGADDKMLEGYTLLAVAKYADICNVFGSPDTMRKNLGILHEHCAKVGRKPEEIKVTRLGSLFLTKTADEALSTRQFVVDAMGEEWAREAAMFGDADMVGEQIQELVDAGVEELIFNLPLANNAEEVTAVGDVLQKAMP